MFHFLSLLFIIQDSFRNSLNLDCACTELPSRVQLPSPSRTTPQNAIDVCSISHIFFSPQNIRELRILRGFFRVISAAMSSRRLASWKRRVASLLVSWSHAFRLHFHIIGETGARLAMHLQRLFVLVIGSRTRRFILHCFIFLPGSIERGCPALY